MSEPYEFVRRLERYGFFLDLGEMGREGALVFAHRLAKNDLLRDSDEPTLTQIRAFIEKQLAWPAGTTTGYSSAMREVLDFISPSKPMLCKHCGKVIQRSADATTVNDWTHVGGRGRCATFAEPA